MTKHHSISFHVACLLAVWVIGFGTPSATAGVPVVTTLPASGQLNTVAQLNGTVNPNGLATTGWFEWGTSTFDYSRHTASADLGNGAVTVSLTNLLSGLTPGVIYHGRLVATNADGLSRGGDVTFGSPRVVLNGAALLTNALGSPYPEPGAVASAALLAIAGGGMHSLALRSDGTVTGWGHNDYGQTTIPGGLGDVVSISAGGQHSLALRRNGTVVAWGNNAWGLTSVPAGLSNVVSISAGGLHNLALRGDGTVVDWGTNADGQLPIPAGLSHVVAVAAGDTHCLALRNDGTVVGWGGSSYVSTTVPAGLSNVVTIAAGGDQSLALRSDGSLVTWARIDFALPLPTNLTHVVAIAQGAGFGLALSKEGKVNVWGDDFYGVTALPAGLDQVVALAAGMSHGLALRGDGTEVVWGAEAFGYTTPPADLNHLPVTVSGSVDVNTLGSYTLTYTSTNVFGGVGSVSRTVAVVASPIAVTLAANGQSNTVAQLNGTVNPNGSATTGWFEWGTSPADYSQRTAPVDLGKGTVAVGLSAALDSLTPGTVYHGRIVAANANGLSRGGDVALGSPQMFLLGTASLTNAFGNPYLEPGAVTGEAAMAIAAGEFHGLALRRNGTVVGWGSHAAGETAIPAGLDDVTAIAAAASHSLALRRDGTVVAWGDSRFGLTNIPAGLSNAVAIAAGRLHHLALRSDGTVVGWGAGTPENNGEPTGSSMGQATIPDGLSNVVAIAAGAYHSLALRNDGTVVAWGDNRLRQLNIPAGLDHVVAISTRSYHNLALRSDGTVVAWGEDNGFHVPPGLGDVVAIADGETHSLALRSDGSIVAWGDNGYDQDTMPAGLTNVTAIAAGNSDSFALQRDGTVVGWGWNPYGETDIPAELKPLPVTVTGSVDVTTPGRYTLTYTSTNALGGVGSITRTVVVSVPLPAALTLAVSGQLNTVAQVNGTVNPNGLATTGWFEWGTSTFDYSRRTAPVELGSGMVAVGISNLLSGLTPGIIYHGRLVATNADGISRGNDVAFGSPRVVLNGAATLPHALGDAYVDPGAAATGAVLAIAAGGVHSLALRSDGTVVGWGHNEFGQTNIPAGLDDVVSISAGGNFSLALRRVGTVAGWGNNDSGQTSIPFGLNDVVSISAGGLHGLALRRDGTVTGWGTNGNGQVTIPAGLSNVVAVAAGSLHSLALRSDGTVVGWGSNRYGETTVPAGLTNIVAIAAGAFQSLALRSDGTVVEWGYADISFGQTGMPSGLDDVVAIALGGFSLALRSDGTVSAWGDGTYGQTSPPDGLNQVVAIAAGGIHGLALRSDGTVAVWGARFLGFTDIPDGLDTLPVAVSGTVDVNTPGSYTLTYTSTNALGGVGAVSRTVTVAALPAVATLAVTGQSNTVAQLNGMVNPNGTATTGWFEWGTSVSDYSQRTAPVDLGDGSAPVGLNSLLSNLTPGVIYHGRTVATNEVGLSKGADVAFGTPRMVLLGAASVTNGLGAPYLDPGAVTADAPVAVAAGGYHNLALRGDGTVVAWGYNLFGQTTLPAGLRDVAAVAAGTFHSLALRNDGTVVGWGDNRYGQTTVPAGLGHVVAIAAGGFHSLALLNDGTVVAWGAGTKENAGDGTGLSLGQSIVPEGLRNVDAIAAGAYHSLALLNDGTVVAWGDNRFGQLNIPTLGRVTAISAANLHSLALQSNGSVAAWGNVRQDVPFGLGDVVGIADGYYHSLALRRDGTVTAWGEGGNGQTNVPAGLGHVTAIAAGSDDSFALQRDGTVVGWGGSDEYGQINIPTGLKPLPVAVIGSVDVTTPGRYTLTYTSTNALGGTGSITRTVVVPAPLPTVLTLAASGQLNTVAQLNGTVNPNGTATTGWFEWGTSASDYGRRTAPVELGKGSAPLPLSSQLNGLTPGMVYHGRTVATNEGGLSRGDVVVFGSPRMILLGAITLTNGLGNPYADPGAVSGETPMAIAAGGYHSLALRYDGTVVGWGYNAYGQTTIPAGLGDVVAIAAGTFHSLALRRDGTVAGWGDNSYGQTTVPTGLSNVVAVAGAGYHSLALRSDGTVVGWGDDSFGQTTIPAGLDNVVTVAGGMLHSLALRRDGTVVGWGDNRFGQTTIPAGVGRAVVSIAAAGLHSLALRYDGAAVGWGDNYLGQRTVPSGLGTLVALADGDSHSLALRSDGRVVGWGDNSFGQTAIPTALGNVGDIAAGSFHNLALRRDGVLLAWGRNDYGQATVPAGLRPLPVILSSTVDWNTPGTYTMTFSSVNAWGGVGTVTRTVVIISPAYPPVLTGAYLDRLGDGAFRFSFINAPRVSFSVWGSTNLALPWTQWSNLGPAIEVPSSSGFYQFSDPSAAGSPQRFYRLSSP